MTSELEKMAEEFAELETTRTDQLDERLTALSLGQIDGITAFRAGCTRGFLAGAKAVLEFARLKSYPIDASGGFRVTLADLEDFFTESSQSSS